MLIRPATPADEADIAALCQESLALDPDAAELTGILRASPDRQVALVSEEAGKVTGIACGARRREPAGVRGYVHLLAVTPPARGAGADARLLRTAEDELRSGGATEIWLGQGPRRGCGPASTPATRP